MLFIFTLPIVTVVRGFLPQSQEETPDPRTAGALDKNGTMQGGSHGDNTEYLQRVLVGQTAEQAKIPWFTALQNTLNSFTERLCARK